MRKKTTAQNASSASFVRGRVHGKSFFDVTLSCLFLLVLLPLFLLLAVLVKIQDGGPVFFRQDRIGRGGVPFRIIKFRSMRPDSGKPIEEQLSPEQLERYYAEYKLENDPRVTRIGRFLRRSSLDELPQLLNILRGDMSLVGPRPIVETERRFYTPDEQRELFSVRPGLTGYWQVKGRNRAAYSTGERQRMELNYVRHASLSLDIRIFFKTFLSVFSTPGN